MQNAIQKRNFKYYESTTTNSQEDQLNWEWHEKISLNKDQRIEV
jgi:hypothetical protein